MARDDDLRDAVRSLESRVADLEADSDARSARSALYGATAVVSVLLVFLPPFEGPEPVSTIWEAVGRGDGILALTVVGVVAAVLVMAAVGFHSPGLLIAVTVASAAFGLVLLLKPGTGAAATLTPVAVTAAVLYFLTAFTSVVQLARR